MRDLISFGKGLGKGMLIACFAIGIVKLCDWLIFPFIHDLIVRFGG